MPTPVLAWSLEVVFLDLADRTYYGRAYSVASVRRL